MALSATAWVNHYSISEIGDVIFHMEDKLHPDIFLSFFFSGHFEFGIKDHHSDAHLKLIVFSPLVNVKNLSALHSEAFISFSRPEHLVLICS